ncbi:MAG: ABC transporter permease subunit [Myxococcota bacterium]
MSGSAVAPTPHSVRTEAGRQLGWAAAALLILVVSARASEASTAALTDPRAIAAALSLLRGLASPARDPDFLAQVARLTGESLAIAAAGMAGAVMIALPAALAAARVPGLSSPPGPRPLALVRPVVRAGLSLLRAVPEIVWAFLFVRILGLGPGPAVVAIALSFGGIMGKLFAELVDAIDPEPARALEAAGATRLTILLHAVVPQVRAGWLAYGLFRFECALRSAAILGVVGAGGLGTEIDLAIRYLEYDRLATALLAILACIAVFELVSAALRPLPRAPRTSLAMLLIAGGLASSALGLPLEALTDPAAARQTAAFFDGFLRPSVAANAWREAAALMVQTLGMAAFATCLAAAAAWLVAPCASRNVTVTGFLPAAPQPQNPAGTALRWALWSLTRTVLAVCRALPDLVWALVFVVWVGPGPFAGALAVAAHTLGILGRLFGEVIEQETPDAASAEASGMGRYATWLHVIAPASRRRLLAFGLFRFEVNVRATAAVGFVGAGGIGDAIHTAISLFQFSDLARYLTVLALGVIALDTAGDRVRRRMAS